MCSESVIAMAPMPLLRWMTPLAVLSVNPSMSIVATAAVSLTPNLQPMGRSPQIPVWMPLHSCAACAPCQIPPFNLNPLAISNNCADCWAILSGIVANFTMRLGVLLISRC